MKLYGTLASPYVARVLLVARAKGIELPLEMPAGGLQSPEYLALNPLGKMPTLEVDGKSLPESTVVCEYLEDAYPRKPLLPKDPYERARVRLLARLTDIYVMSQTGAIFRNMNPAGRNQAEFDAATGSLRSGCEHIEHFMASGPYATGKSLTLADCVMLPSFEAIYSLYGMLGRDPVFDELPRLTKWWRALHSDAMLAEFAQQYVVAFQKFVDSRRH
ncbi:MAG: glutathione S-transferase family protein [Steroidobacteraceae bacterium]